MLGVKFVRLIVKMDASLLKMVFQLMDVFIVNNVMIYQVGALFVTH